MSNHTLFLSATDDLDEVLHILRDAFSRAGYYVFTGSRHWHGDPPFGLRLIRDFLDESDFVIHLAGLAYGAEAEGPAFTDYPEFQCSYTQFEYYYACQQMKPVISLVCRQDFPYWPFTEEGKDAVERERRRQLQLTHRERVITGRFTGTPLESYPPRQPSEPIADVKDLVLAVFYALVKIRTFPSDMVIKRAALEELHKLLIDGVHLKYLERVTLLQQSIAGGRQTRKSQHVERTATMEPREVLLEEASLRQLPQPQDLACAPLEPEPRFDKNVQFTVYRPRVVAPERWHLLLAFAHLDAPRPDALDDEPNPLEEVRRLAEQALEGQVRDYGTATYDSSQALPREGEITFLPWIDGVEFNPARYTFRWVESVHKAEFRLRAPAALDGREAKGAIAVFWGSLQIAEVVLRIRVDSSHKPTTHDVSEPSSARRYRNIFASYSHKDVDIVRQVEAFTRATGDQYIRDCTHLRSGEIWDERLKALIASADFFQLFWSSNSMRSRFVREEWEYALSLERPEFVRGVYWEEPMPESPEEDLPPERLKRTHIQPIGTPMPSTWAGPVADDRASAGTWRDEAISKPRAAFDRDTVITVRHVPLDRDRAVGAAIGPIRIECVTERASAAVRYEKADDLPRPIDPIRPVTERASAAARHEEADVQPRSPTEATVPRAISRGARPRKKKVEPLSTGLLLMFLLSVVFGVDHQWPGPDMAGCTPPPPTRWPNSAGNPTPPTAELLLDAVKRGDIEQVKVQVLGCPSIACKVDARDESGWTPLHWAASRDQVDVAKVLLGAGADVNARNKNDETPLHWAAAKDHADVAKVLLDAGADVNARNKEGETPLRWASKWGQTADVPALLFTHGATE